MFKAFKSSGKRMYLASLWLFLITISEYGLSRPPKADLNQESTNKVYIGDYTHIASRQENSPSWKIFHSHESHLEEGAKETKEMANFRKLLLANTRDGDGFVVSQEVAQAYVDYALIKYGSHNNYRGTHKARYFLIPTTVAGGLMLFISGLVYGDKTNPKFKSCKDNTVGLLTCQAEDEFAQPLTQHQRTCITDDLNSIGSDAIKAKDCDRDINIEQDFWGNTTFEYRDREDGETKVCQIGACLAKGFEGLCRNVTDHSFFSTDEKLSTSQVSDIHSTCLADSGNRISKGFMIGGATLLLAPTALWGLFKCGQFIGATCKDWHQQFKVQQAYEKLERLVIAQAQTNPV